MLYLITLTFVTLAGSLPGKQPVCLSDPDKTATAPRLTTDQHGNPVLTWVEQTDEQKTQFYFATSTDGGQTFSGKIQVNAPANILTHAEGMPKLAFKADGTLFALFEVSRPTEKWPFAGELLFTTSADRGKTWTEPKPLHADQSPGQSHSFADLARLPNGEIGVVWLDAKLPGKSGRSVRFVQTLSDGSFSPEMIVDSNACQCCRSNILIDSQQRIHLAYRDMLSDGSRDISTVVSADGGHHFSVPSVVWPDRWQINACPHSGPMMTEVNGTIYTTWFTGKQNAIGLRLATGQRLTAAIPSDRSKHPQITSWKGQLVWLWDQSVSLNGRYRRKITLSRPLAPNTETMFVTSDEVDASLPTALPTSQGLLIAYEQQVGTQKSTVVARLLTNLQ